MPKYSVCLAFDVTCYANIEVEAEDETAAVELASEHALERSFTVDWDTATPGAKMGDPEYIGANYRLVDIHEIN